MNHHALYHDSDQVDDILEMFRGNYQHALTFIEMYMEQIPRYVQELSDAMDHEDAKTIQHLSHMIRGSASMIGADNLQCAAESMETLSQAGRMAEVESSYRSLRNEMRRLAHLLSAYGSTLAREHSVEPADSSLNNSSA